MGEILLFLFEYQKRCPPTNHAANTALCLSPSLVALLVMLEQLSRCVLSYEVHALLLSVLSLLFILN